MGNGATGYGRMKITFSTPTLLKVEWPLYDDATHQEIVRRLSTVPGIEAGRGRSCYAPMIQLQRIMLLFPKASFDYRAMQESDTLARRFFDSMVTLGIGFDFDEFDDPMAVGDNVSPLIRQLVHDRRHALKPLLIEAMANPKPVRLKAEPVTSPPITEDEKLGPLFRGIQNAAKKAEVEKFKYPRRRRKSQEKG